MIEYLKRNLERFIKHLVGVVFSFLIVAILVGLFEEKFLKDNIFSYMNEIYYIPLIFVSSIVLYIKVIIPVIRLLPRFEDKHIKAKSETIKNDMKKETKTNTGSEISLADKKILSLFDELEKI